MARFPNFFSGVAQGAQAGIQLGQQQRRLDIAEREFDLRKVDQAADQASIKALQQANTQTTQQQVKQAQSRQQALGTLQTLGDLVKLPKDIRKPQVDAFVQSVEAQTGTKLADNFKQMLRTGNPETLSTLVGEIQRTTAKNPGMDSEALLATLSSPVRVAKGAGDLFKVAQFREQTGGGEQPVAPSPQARAKHQLSQLRQRQQNLMQVANRFPGRPGGKSALQQVQLIDNKIRDLEAFIRAPEKVRLEEQARQDVRSQSLTSQDPTSVQLLAAGAQPGQGITQEQAREALRLKQETTPPTTSIQIGGREKFVEEVAKNDAERLNKVQTNARVAADKMRSTERVLTALRGFETGALADARSRAGALIEFAGADPNDFKALIGGQPGSAEVIESELNQIGLQFAEQLNDRNLSNQQLKFIRNISGTLSTTRNGLEMLMTLAQRDASKTMARAEFIENFQAEYGGLTLQGERAREAGVPSAEAALRRIQAGKGDQFRSLVAPETYDLLEAEVLDRDMRARMAGLRQESQGAVVGRDLNPKIVDTANPRQIGQLQIFPIRKGASYAPPRPPEDEKGAKFEGFTNEGDRVYSRPDGTGFIVRQE